MPWTRPPANRVIALATDGRAPGATQDDALVLSILAERCAARIEAVAWDSPRPEWGRYGAVLIRSTWDYHLRLAAFLDWTERVEAAGVALWNPAAVVRWNADKRYLHALARAGVPVVPTERIHRGTATDLRSVLHRRGWNQVVVKPSVSAAAFQTWVTHLEQTDTHSALLSAVLARGDALVQPFLPEVRGEGEWSSSISQTEAAHWPSVTRS